MRGAGRGRGGTLFKVLTAVGFVGAAAVGGYGAAYYISGSAAAPTPHSTLPPPAVSPSPSPSPMATPTGTPATTASTTVDPTVTPPLSESPSASISPGGTQAPGPSPTVHVVASGETLTSIARRYGVTVEQIVDANHISDPNKVRVGQKLIIPTP